MIRARSLVIAALFLCACEKTPTVVQPIQFSHKVHTEKGITCDACHASVEKASSAGIPTTDTCMLCHQATITDSPEEEKVRQYAEKGLQIPWQQVYRVPAHVYFSHRRHVSLGNLKCVQCHGKVADSVVPVTVAAVPVQMDRCLGCHAQGGVTTDCNACHR